MVVDRLGDLRRQRARGVRVERQALAEEHVLQAHAAQADRAPAQVAAARGLDRVEVQVDHPVELAHGQAHGLGELVEIEIAVRIQVVAEVDRAQVAHRRLLGRGDLEDLGAQVGQVDDVAGAQGLVAGLVALVLERHPAVAGLGQGAHHARVQLARRHRLDRLALGLGLHVGALERLPVQVGELRHHARIEQRPWLVGLHPLHEQVRHPVGEVEVVGTAGIVAGVVAQFQEVLDVGVPGLQVDAGRTLALAALVDRRDRGVERLQPRHDAVGMAVGGPDQRAARTHPGVAHADAAAELGQLGDVAVTGVDRLERILRRIQQEARRQLLVAGAGVEQGRAGRQVVQVAQPLVQRQRLGHVLGQRAGDAQEELLRGFDHLAGVRVAQQVAVVQRAQAEVVEVEVVVGVDRIVELARVDLDEVEQALVDQAHLMAAAHRLRERVDLLAGYLLRDEVGQQARGQAAVLGLLADQQRRGPDRQFVQLLGGGAVVQPGDGARGHAHRIDRMQAVAATLDGADDLVQVHRLGAAIALGHAHGGGGRRRGQFEAGLGRDNGGIGGGHGNASSWRGARGACPRRNQGRWRATSMEGRRRSIRDGHDPRSPPALPRRQPSSPRRLRSRHRALCFARLSAGLRTHGRGGGGLLLLPPLPKASGLSAWWRVRSQLPLRGSAGLAIEGVTGFPFNPAGSNPPEPTGHKIVGVNGPVNAKSCG